MPDPFELDLTYEIFVPEGVMVELWTVAEHVHCWFPLAAEDLLRATVQTPSDAQCRLHWTTSTKPSGDNQIKLSASLTEMGGKTRIDLHAEGFTDTAERNHHAAQWRLALRQLEDYLTVI